MKIKFQNLSKQYEPGQVILNPMDFEDEVHTLAVIGPSGGGKSTLLRIIGGLIAPTTGKLWVDSDEIRQNEASLQQYRKTIGFVFQQGGLFRHMSALDNIAVPLEQVHGYSRTKSRSRALELLERFGLKEDARKKPAALSGGQQQRVAIARALAMDPQVLYFDEPTSALDPELTQGVLRAIRELSSRHMTMAIVTHEMAFARDVADRVVFMDGGRVVEEGPAEQVIDHPAEERTREFLASY